MRSKKSLPISRLLGRSRYSQLLARARAFRELEILIGELIPPPLNTHCRFLSCHDRTLFMAADSPVWAARLRFHGPQLVKQLSKHQTVNLRTVRVRVRAPAKPSATAGKPSGYKLSGHTRKLINQTADTVSDTGLKSALQRISQKAHDP
jgi:hypothetical protein